ncbi:two-component sensor histidine kinase [Rhizobium sp. BK275]|uniref:sensor histidine kinase n=1 Tax=unclassified Rhizobium TaxID=2613769 RepID=UPI00161D9B1A|nr:MULTISPECIES: sensor histidine kinase [unclassified Rhizobium]MBB3392248.1 two-component sensor histidine kinase [Rhizobium sp. BK275]MBB3411030.1 two-component sensor histidine kinase [Rhizobium sp. BK316]
MKFAVRLFPKAAIGTYLVAMAVAIALPIFAFVALLLMQLEDNQRSTLKRETAQDALALSRTIDRQLQDMATTLRLLSSSPELEGGDYESFYNRTETALRGDTLYVIAVDRAGQQFLNTRRAFGTPLGKTTNIAAFEAAMKSGRIEASDVFVGATSGTWVYNVTLPRDEDPVAALIITQNANDLAKLVTTEGLASGWSAAVIDQGGHVVASRGPANLQPGEAFDPRILPSLVASSGVFEDSDILPHAMLGYAQIPGWSWKTVVWGPIATAQAPILSTWRFLLIGGLVLLLVAVLAAYAVARQVRSTIREIADMANRLGEGHIVSPVETSVIEANQVAIALSNASFDRSQSEDRLRFVMHELVHRTKNLLTLVLAMMRQLSKQADSVETFRLAVAHRLEGLVRSIELLTGEQWSGVSLHRVIDIHLQAFPQAREQVKIEGTDFILKPDAVQNLGLALHELATNSVKYGALSVPQGRVRFEWQPAEDDMLRFTWTESGGPPVKPPARTGFGTTVIKAHAAAAFRGKVDIDFRPEGLVWILTAQRGMMERE